MRILVTNDDGIDSPGLSAMVAALRRERHVVVVIAPDGERSGSSSSLGTVVDGVAIPIRTVQSEAVGDPASYAIDAPPAVAVRAACVGCFGRPPGIVVSGVNPGPNTERRLVHSGTFGVALTAASHDVPGLALSTAGGTGPGLASAVTVAAWAVDELGERGLPPLALNINVPDLLLPDMSGIRSAELSRMSVSDVSFEGVDGELRVRRWRNRPPFDPGTDADLLSRGYVTVTHVALPWSWTGEFPDIVPALERRWREHRERGGLT